MDIFVDSWSDDRGYVRKLVRVFGFKGRRDRCLELSKDCFRNNGLTDVPAMTIIRERACAGYHVRRLAPSL